MTDNFYLYAFLCIIVSAVFTALTRFLPFILFSGQRKMSPRFKRIADILPSAVIAVLVIYGLSPSLSVLDLTTLSSFVALSLCVLVHLWKSNTLLSMFVGTGTYMLLIHILPI